MILTLHYKPKSIVKPDYYIRQTEAWIVYPHERYEFIKSICSKLRKKGKTVDEVRVELKKIGLEPELVDKFVEEAYGKAT